MRHRMLRLDGVSKRFGGLVALHNLSFEVEAGSITSLIGPNGAGKTTAFNVISGVLPATTGRIWFKDSDVSQLAPFEVCQLGMARTFQNCRLFPNLNVIENVLAARYVRTRKSLWYDLGLPLSRTHRSHERKLAEGLIDLVGIAQSAYALPSELSYGNQRRLEIARALATEPDMLLLDEPVAGMMAQEAAGVMSLVSDLNKRGKTIVLIEHNMNLVMSISHRIIVLNFGTKIADGSPAEIRDNAEVLEAYLGTEE